jgi:biotin-dependent carboxylase-like uncharacterized protein
VSERARGIVEVVAVAGLSTVQDLGRPGYMHEGVPRGGALVPELLAWTNDAVGNAASAAAIEVVGGLSLRAGSAARVSVDGEPARDLAAGERIDVPPHPTRRVRYVALAGGVDVPPVLGSRSTLLVAALGGHQGRALRKGDRLLTFEATPARAGAAPRALAGDLDLVAPIAVVPGPDLARFDGAALAALLGGVFTVSPASDRTGTRLVGAALPHAARAGGRDDGTRSVSTPMVPGAIEVPASGAPIVLGPDHPTTGGYPVIATIVQADLGRFAARKIGAEVCFTAVLPRAPGLFCPRK